MEKEEIVNQLNEKLEGGFTKAQLERIIELPKNCLSGFMAGSKTLSKVSMLKIKDWLLGTKFLLAVPTGSIKILDATKPNREIKPAEQPKTNYSINTIPVASQQEFDFTGEKFLVIEKYTKFKEMDRPKNKFERAIWDTAKKTADDKIRKAWEARNKK